MKIAPFGVEEWMNRYETRCELNLAETCVESLTMEELLAITGHTDSVLGELLPMKLTYGAIEGTERLRRAIAALYASRGPADILVTHGAIGANALVYQALVEPGDRVVSLVPTYQQHYSIPEALGGDVVRVPLRTENAFVPDVDEVRRAADGRAKLIAFSNPNNPTGALMDKGLLEALIAVAEGCGASVVSDEVYRGVDQEGSGTTESVADLYEKGVATGSMSKSFSLAGLRLGWVTAGPDVLTKVAVHRDYNTISVSMLDDFFASLALENRDAILARSRDIVRTNLAVLDAWVAKEPRISYVKPRSGTTALLEYDLDVPSRDLAVELLESEGVLYTPGSALDIEGYLRIGFANNRAALEEGLRRTSELLSTYASRSVGKALRRNNL